MEGLKNFTEMKTILLIYHRFPDDLKNINSYLEKINIKLNLRLIDHVSWNVFSLKKLFYLMIK